ncbi:hypothetical protein HL667_14630 [Bradyrhizobium sp. 83012]|uniref:Uncharacterized protein n=1 Tax=Bradyrhizobium aeschynomenes TaxID=2734909 RepID=A0ABX2CG51_9BRAD|nr:hypothetical protein [Bradyrhizobium aeschynomenes]NPU66237.1 hypothetical protein [Bradyrhizobium aeschynomenes]
MAAAWERKRVLIAVRTYPVPATKSIEASCTAGITEDGKWIRLFPVPFRLMAADNRFSKWQWITTDLIKAADARPESYKLNSDTIVAEGILGTDGGWRARKGLMRTLMRPSMCCIRREQDAQGYPTLGIFRPSRIKRLVLEKAEPKWSDAELAILKQDDLFQKAPSQTLEKIPFKFMYDFDCSDPECRGHSMSCTDWEMAEAYRRWRGKYGNEWEPKFRARFEREMIHKNDTHFIVGTVHKHPKNWIIVGLFYPPKQATADLFDL